MCVSLAMFVCTSDLLFEGRDESDGLLKNSEFRLRFIRMKMQGHHTTQLLKRLVYVTNTNPNTQTHVQAAETQTHTDTHSQTHTQTHTDTHGQTDTDRHTHTDR